MMMQTHTYINIRPGHRPQVVKQSSLPLLSPDSQTSKLSDGAVPNGVVNGGADKWGREEGGGRGDGGRGGGEGVRGGSDSVRGGGDGGRGGGEGVKGSGHSGRDKQVTGSGRKEKRKGEGDRFGSASGKPAAVVERPPLPPPQETEEEGDQRTSPDAGKKMSPTMTKRSVAVGEPGGEGVRSPSGSPIAEQRRPLLVHHYENFPFSPSTDAGEKDRNAGNQKTSPTSPQPIPMNRRESTRSEISQMSITPPLPERNYSQSELNCSPTPPLPERHYLSPSPPSSADLPGNVFVPIQNSMETDSPRSTQLPVLTPSGRDNKVDGDRAAPLPVFKSSQPRVVERTVSQQGSEYAIVNPAWKKNMKGRAPSLSGESDKSSTLGSDAGETPPPLPARPVDFNKSMERSTHGGERSPRSDARGYVDLDSSFVEKKRTELDVSSRFDKSVQYAVVQLESPTGPNSKLNNPPRGKRGPRTGGDGYEQVDLEEQHPTGE